MSTYIPSNIVPHRTINNIRDLVSREPWDPNEANATLETIKRQLSLYPTTPEPPAAAKDNFYELIEAVSKLVGPSAANTFTAVCQERGVRKLPPILRDFVSTISIQTFRNGMIFAALLTQDGLDPLEVLHEHAAQRAKSTGRLEEMRALEHYRTLFGNLVLEFLNDVLAGRPVLEPVGGVAPSQSEETPAPSSTNVAPV